MKMIKLILKDLKSLFRDPKIVAVLIAMPVVLMSILGFALSGVFSDSYTIDPFKIAIVKEYDVQNDQERVTSAISQSIMGSNMSANDMTSIADGVEDISIEDMFFNQFLGSEEIQSVMTYDILSKEIALKELENNVYSAVVILPANFTFDSYINLLTPFRNLVEIEIIKSPNHRITSSITESIILAYSDTFASYTIAKNVLFEQFFKYDLLNQGFGNMDELITNLSKEKARFNIETVTVAGKNPINASSYYAISMLSLFLLFSAAHGSTLLLKEKKDFTLQRMLVSGYTKVQVIIAKSVVVFSVALIQMLIMINYSHFMFNVNWGNAVAVLTVVILSAFAIAGLGTLFSVITLKMENYMLATAMESVVFQILGLLGGAYIPVQVLPEILQKLSIVPINGVVLKAFMQVMSGSSLLEIKTELLLIICNGLLFGGVAIILVLLERRGEHVNNTQTRLQTS